MRFVELAAFYERLEATTKRLEMRKILVELIDAVGREELAEVLYLSQGLLRPEYEGVELGMAESLATKAVAAATNAEEPAVVDRRQRSGDLGLTAAELITALPAAPERGALLARDVYATLTEIAHASGEGSQEVKVGLFADLLRRCTPAEAKFAVRFAIGTLRLGVRELTILDALTQKYGGGTKEARLRIEAAFNLSSDLGLVAETLAKDGLEGLTRIQLQVGRPIRPMLAERATSLADILERMEGEAALEYKYDGLRVQAHVPVDGPVKLFSRRLEDLSAQFPELVAALPEAISRKPAIVEGECVAIDADTDQIRPFQDISRRRGRKYDLERMQEEIPVCLYLFDVLLDDDVATVDEPFPDRRRRLVSLVRGGERVRVATQSIVKDVDAAQLFLDAAIAEGGEGVMAKSVATGSAYRAGARGFWWIKYKRDYTQRLGDSIDGVIVGAFHGRGRRGGRYGALLLAVYDAQNDRFESFTKVGSGFDDATLEEIPKRLASLELSERPKGVESGLEPDRWIQPRLVIEVRGAELTLSPIHRAGFEAIRPGAGLALRFPRFTGVWRDDKAATNATTSAELLTMYRSQVKHAEEPSDDSAS
ncbi:MAG: ATP-dependent DNA ligase [Thermoplasmata archaeon]|nr:ATP-dependent DNA ligase [Thermoplasmata archaeon]